MADDNKQNAIIGMLPDWMIFRKLASKTKIRLAYKTAIPDAEVHSGENSSDEKHRIVERCKKDWSSSAMRIDSMINEIFQTVPYYSDSRLDLKKIREDMFWAYFAYGFTPNEYFAFGLENKPENLRRTFISSRLRMKYRCQMNNILQAHIFNDKTETYIFFKDQYQRDAIAIEKQTDFPEFHNFIQRHPVFVKKQVYQAQGNSVALIDMNKSNITEKELFESFIKNGKHILEEKIIQTPEMSAFNESSVNTVRAITFNTKHGLKVPYCIIRTGRQGTFVDNSGAGGVQAEIDFDTGTVISDGFDELGGKYLTHPSSGTVFKGYKLPDWNQLKELIFASAKKVPQIRFIGWDLAHTKNGWVIVEGNENCYIIALQQIRDEGMRSIFENLMDDMDLYA